MRSQDGFIALGTPCTECWWRDRPNRDKRVHPARKSYSRHAGTCPRADPKSQFFSGRIGCVRNWQFRGVALGVPRPTRKRHKCRSCTFRGAAQFLRAAVTMRSLVGVLAVGLSVFSTGCASVPTDSPNVTSPAVVIDFYAGDAPSGSCSGTLIAENLVLTAAHCAAGSTGAVVTAPALSASVPALRVLQHQDASDASEVDVDIAVVVLGAPLKLERYPALGTCSGCTVSQVMSDIGGKAAASATARLSTAAPAAYPNTRYLEQGLPDSGGAVYQIDDDGRAMSVVGVTVGRGETTGGGYVADLAVYDFHAWLQAVVEAGPTLTSNASNALNASSRSSATESGLQPQGVTKPAAVQKLNDNLLGGSSPTLLSGSGDPLLVPTPPTKSEVIRGPVARSAARPCGAGATVGAGAPKQDCNSRYSTQLIFDVTREGKWHSLGTSNSKTNPNAVGYFSDDDLAFSTAQSEAKAINARGYNYFTGHGDAGVLYASSKELPQFMSNSYPSLLTSCHGGDIRNGNSAAYLLAKNAGVDPASVWGCTGNVWPAQTLERKGKTITLTGISCRGAWVNGNGELMPTRIQKDLDLACIDSDVATVTCRLPNACQLVAEGSGGVRSGGVGQSCN